LSERNDIFQHLANKIAVRPELAGGYKHVLEHGMEGSIIDILCLENMMYTGHLALKFLDVV